MSEPLKTLISICIPAYKRGQFLRRLLDSISIQTFKEFEVIVTDDSPDNDIKDICSEYAQSFVLRYFKNEQALGTPENWNAAIRKAQGDWIKIMHDDDWFSSGSSLAGFAMAINRHKEAKFLFCSYSNVYEETNKAEPVFFNQFRWRQLLKDPVTLLADNIIGPPSVTIHKNDKKYWYDPQIKWVVDMDFYIRILEYTKPVHINKLLVNVGVNSTQVTKYTFGVPEVHLRESLYLLNKTGVQHLNNIIVFDAWWRLLRNFNIKDESQLRATGYNGNIPGVLFSIINSQQKVPYHLLKFGTLSKMLMLLCYLKVKGSIPQHKS